MVLDFEGRGIGHTLRFRAHFHFKDGTRKRLEEDVSEGDNAGEPENPMAPLPCLREGFKFVRDELGV
jgi:hypothetical protein